MTSQLFLMIRLSQPDNQAPKSIMPKKTQKTNQIHQTRHQGQSKKKCQTALDPIFFCKNCLQNTRKLCLHLKNIRIRFFFGYGDISQFSLSVLRKSVNVFKECTTYDIYSIDTNRHCSSIDCITLSRHLTKALNLCPLHPSGAFQRRTG